jgi:large subunit ribosomal protein L7/L12
VALALYTQKTSTPADQPVETIQQGGRGTMAETLEKIVDQISELSVLELSDLVKQLEEKFGVEAAAPMMMGAMAAPAAGDAGGGDEPTSFDAILKEIGSQKIPVIKEVRAITGLGLKEAKELVDGAPKPIKEGASKEEAEQVREKLEAVGATVEIAPAG